MQIGDKLLLPYVQTARTAPVSQKLPYRHPPQFLEGGMQIGDKLLLLTVQIAKTSPVLQKLTYRHHPSS